MTHKTTLVALIFALLAPALIMAQNSSGPELGSVVDDFSLVDQRGTSRDLASLVKEGPVALVVYRSADW